MIRRACENLERVVNRVHPWYLPPGRLRKPATRSSNPLRRSWGWPLRSALLLFRLSVRLLNAARSECIAGPLALRWQHGQAREILRLHLRPGPE